MNGLEKAMREKPEILAPAGSFVGLRAAIAAGCDAVYIGGMQFGARAYADNLDTQTMVQAIEYCHLHGVRLYLTVNTLLKDGELQGALYDYILPYYEAGLDAVIVQDLGVLRALHRWFPELDLHASTQMNLVLGKGMDRLKQYGITRIVPARELSLQELKQMRQDTDLELEVFVHGALCYCYSGRCLFSSMQGGRSGNRGRCTQPCRMLYHGQVESGYYLSPKELCLLSYLPALIQAGVNSFKIEGRMKRPEYTAFVTSVYRYYVDLYQELGQDGFAKWKNEHAEKWQDDLRKLAELYNREGFTSGYLEGKAGTGHIGRPNPAEMLSIHHSRHGGVRVGSVISVNRQFAEYQLERDVFAQDVVEFRDLAGQTIYEYTLGEDFSSGRKIRARYQKGCQIRVGDGVYRTRHPKLLEEIERKYLTLENKLAVTGVFTAQAGKACTLTLCRQDCLVTVTGDVVEPASSQPATEESVRKALNQTGNSIFYFQDLEITLEGNVFLPVGMLKRLRRAALEELQQALLAAGKRTTPRRTESQEDMACVVVGGKQAAGNVRVTEADLAEKPCRETEDWAVTDRHSRCVSGEPIYSAAVMMFEQLQPVLHTDIVDEVILRMDRMTDQEIKTAASQVRLAGKRLVLGMPAIWRESVWRASAEQFARKEGIFWQLKPDGYLIQNMESFAFLQEVAGVSADQIRTDASLYVMNREAAEWWLEQGVRQMTAPWELTGREWQQSLYKDLQQVIIYGHIPLMVSAQCVVCNTGQCVGAERDDACGTAIFHGEKNRQFMAMHFCKYCYNIIYQGKPFSILREREALQKNGLCQWRYEFTVETPEQVRQILAGEVPKEFVTGHYDKDVF